MTPMRVLIERAKAERKARKAEPCRVQEAPENGLLVPELVEVAHRVYHARSSLLSSLAQLVRFIPVLRCQYVATSFESFIVCSADVVLEIESIIMLYFKIKQFRVKHDI